MMFDTSDRDAVAELSRRQGLLDEEFMKTCRKLGLDVIRLTAGESVVKPVCRLFSERERKMAMQR